MVLKIFKQLRGLIANSVFLFGLSVTLPVQAASFAQLVDRCAPEAPLSILAAIAQLSSHFDPLAVRLPDDLVHQKFNRIDDAVKAIDRLSNAGQGDVQIGLMGFERSFLKDRSISVEAAFDPCKSIFIMADYLDRAPVLKGKPEYYAAFVGLHPDEPEFASSVLALLKKGALQPSQVVVGLDNPPDASRQKITKREPDIGAVQSDDTPTFHANWDVYGRSMGRTVLIYSKTGQIP